MQPKPSACHHSTILYQQRSFSPGVKCICVNQLFSNTFAFVDVIKKGCCDVITVSVTGSSTLTVRAGRGCEMKTSAERLDFTVVHSMWALCTSFLRPFPIKNDYIISKCVSVLMVSQNCRVAVCRGTTAFSISFFFPSKKIFPFLSCPNTLCRKIISTKALFTPESNLEISVGNSREKEHRETKNRVAEIIISKNGKL